MSFNYVTIAKAAAETGYTVQAIKAKIRDCVWTRHSYASRMLTAEESPMWVAEQMGHSDWGMIRRIYGKYIPGSHPEAGQKACAMFDVQRKEM